MPDDSLSSRPERVNTISLLAPLIIPRFNPALLRDRLPYPPLLGAKGSGKTILHREFFRIKK